MPGFSGTDDLINEISTNGKKFRSTLNKVTGITTAYTAGRAYDLSILPGSPDRIGPGEHLINSFAPSSLFNWTANGTGFAATANTFAKTSGTATTLTADSQNIAIVSGRFYRVQYTISAWTSSNVNFTLGGATGTVRAATGTFVEIITASSTAGFVLQASVNTGVWSVSNISVVEWGAASGTITPMFQPFTTANCPAMFHGGNVSTDLKSLLNMGLMTTAATGVGQFYLVDLLGSYPYIDANSALAQTCSNTNVLARYTNGAGVRAFLSSGGTGYVVTNVAPTTVGAGAHNVAMTYTNQANTGSRQMPFTVSCTASAIQGHISHSGVAANNYFPLPLANNDAGIRSIQSIQLSTGTGTAGTYYHMYLYKELAMLPVPALNVYYERDFVNMMPSLEQIPDGAVLGLIYVAGGATAGATTFLGHVETAWG
ncbi:MAG: hypothetical protein ACRC1W_05785 [Shewanella sp.]